MNYICEGVYVGTVDDAYRTERLREAGITHILTVETKPLMKEATEGTKLVELSLNSAVGSFSYTALVCTVFLLSSVLVK